MAEISYYTEEGLEKLKAELDHLKNVERPKVSHQIAEARDKGDLSENAEYDAAKEAQGMLEMRIAKMDASLANARIVDESQLDTSKVLIFSTVKLLNHKINQEVSYKLVAENEANIQQGKISVNSPIGKSLLGKKVGEIATVTVPNGTIDLEVLAITRD